MKKIFLALTLGVVLYTTNLNAQSNINWILKEKTDAVFFSKTIFDYSLSGFSTQSEVTAFYNKMRENLDVSSVKDNGKDAKGNYNVSVNMKSVKDESYYLNWAIKLGVAYIINFKGEKKTPQQILTAKNNNVAKPSKH